MSTLLGLSAGLGLISFFCFTGKRSYLENADAISKSQFVSGIVVSDEDQEMLAPESATPCLAYEVKKYRLTEDVVKSDDHGKRIRQNQELVERTFREIRWKLKLDHSSDNKYVYPIGCESMHNWKVNWVQTVSSFREPVGGGSKRTFGYKVKESIIPVGKHVWINGQVNQDNKLVPPLNAAFVVTDKSPHDLRAEYLSSSSSMETAGWIFLSGSMAMGVGGLTSFLNRKQ